MTQTMQSLFDNMPIEDEEIEVPIEDIDVRDYINPPDEFVNSIRRFGIIEKPLICMSSKRSKKYSVLSGRRRVLAAKIAGYTSVKCVLRKGFVYDSATASALTIEANRQVNQNPIAEYKALMTMIKEGYGKDDIKSSLGISESHFKRLSALSALPDNIIEAVKVRKVALSTAINITKLSDFQQDDLISKFESKGFLTGEDIREVKQVRRDSVVQDVMAQLTENMPEYQAGPSVIERVEKLISPDDDLPARTWNAAIEEVLKILRSKS